VRQGESPIRFWFLPDFPKPSSGFNTCFVKQLQRLLKSEHASIFPALLGKLCNRFFEGSLRIVALLHDSVNQPEISLSWIRTLVSGIQPRRGLKGVFLANPECRRP